MGAGAGAATGRAVQVAMRGAEVRVPSEAKLNVMIGYKFGRKLRSHHLGANRCEQF